MTGYGNWGYPVTRKELRRTGFRGPVQEMEDWKMKYIFLAAFWLLTIWHLVDSWRNDQRRRAMSKPFLLLTLALFYVFSAEKISLVLVGALLTSWLGDVLLIPKGHGWFITGGVFFLISHFLFIAVYIPYIQFAQVPWLLIVPVALVYYGISFAVIRAVKPTTPKLMVAPMCLYLLINSTMNVFALMRLITTRSLGGIVGYVGAVLFFVSDCVLYLVRYHKNENLVFRKHFSVMLAYLTGEFLIALGVLL